MSLPISVESFPSGPFETNAYVVSCPETKECALIDPAPDSAAALAEFIAQHNLKPKWIVLTHSHWDHIADTAALKNLYGVPVCIHPLDRGNLENPGSDGLPCWISIQGVTPDKLLAEGDTISVGNLKFRVIYTPGHTPGGICLYEPEAQTLLSGDTLFKGSIGNLSFATARPKEMWTSLDKLALLPPATRVFPGHGPSTSIGKETWLPHARDYFGN